MLRLSDPANPAGIVCAGGTVTSLDQRVSPSRATMSSSIQQIAGLGHTSRPSCTSPVQFTPCNGSVSRKQHANVAGRHMDAKKGDIRSSERFACACYRRMTRVTRVAMRPFPRWRAISPEIRKWGVNPGREVPGADHAGYRFATTSVRTCRSATSRQCRRWACRIAPLLVSVKVGEITRHRNEFRCCVPGRRLSNFSQKV